MDVFLQLVFTLPTVLFTVPLAVCVLYWLLTATGLLEVHGADGWLSLQHGNHIDLPSLGHGDLAAAVHGDIAAPPAPGHADVGAAGIAHHGAAHASGPHADGGVQAVKTMDGMSATLIRFGFGGLPIMLIATVLLLVAWSISYFTDLLLLRHLQGPVQWLLSAATAAVAFIGGVPVTSVVLRPLRRLFAKLQPTQSVSLLGKLAVVRSPEVDAARGYADVADGGAGLVLQVRSIPPSRFRRGERVVLVEYLADDNAYRVIGESELRGA